MVKHFQSNLVFFFQSHFVLFSFRPGSKHSIFVSEKNVFVPKTKPLADILVECSFFLPLENLSPHGPLKRYNFMRFTSGWRDKRWICIFQIFPRHLLRWNIDGSKKIPLLYFLLHSIFQNAFSLVSWNIYVTPPFSQDLH